MIKMAFMQRYLRLAYPLSRFQTEPRSNALIPDRNPLDWALNLSLLRPFVGGENSLPSSPHISSVRAPKHSFDRRGGSSRFVARHVRSTIAVVLIHIEATTASPRSPGPEHNAATDEIFGLASRHVFHLDQTLFGEILNQLL